MNSLTWKCYICNDVYEEEKAALFHRNISDHPVVPRYVKLQKEFRIKPIEV